MTVQSEAVAVPLDPSALTPEHILFIADVAGSAGKLATLAMLDRTPDDFVSITEIGHRLDDAQGYNPGWRFADGSRTTVFSYCSKTLLAAGLVEMGSAAGQQGPTRAARITPVGSHLWPSLAGAYMPWMRQHPYVSYQDIVGSAQQALKNGTSSRVRLFEYLMAEPDRVASTGELQKHLGVSGGTTVGIIHELTNIGLLAGENTHGPGNRFFVINKPNEMISRYLDRMSPEVQAAVNALFGFWMDGSTRVSGTDIIARAKEIAPDIDSRDVWQQFVQWMKNRRTTEPFVTEDRLADDWRLRTQLRVADGVRPAIAEFLNLRTQLATDPGFRAGRAVMGRKFVRSKGRVAEVLRQAKRESAGIAPTEEDEWELLAHELTPPEGASLEELYKIFSGVGGMSIHERSFRRRIYAMGEVFEVRNRRDSDGVSQVGHVTLRTHTFPPTWRDQAICRTRDIDAEVFDPPATDTVEVAQAKMRQAVGFCRQCPVRRICLAEALDADETAGVWGGLTAAERRQLTQTQRDSIVRTAQVATRSQAIQ